MKLSKRVIKYIQDNFNEVLHTTLNPDGPGVVRIHLVPPANIDYNDVITSVAILNGQDYVPVNLSWAILLSEFIKEVNKYDGRELTQQDTDNIVNATADNMSKLYPLMFKSIFKKDISRIMNAFTAIATGQVPNEEIGVMTMGDYAPFMGAPHRMDLMISAMTKNGQWHCNQKCVHCYAAGQTNAEEAEISTDEWKQIIDKCRSACIPQLTFTGGEPTMREDLVELIDYSRWFVTRLNTNGIKLTEDYCGKLRDASLDSMQITFYSADADVHNRLVGAQQFDNTVAGIRNALKAGISTSINTPLCKLNSDYVKTLEFLHELGVMYVTCSGLITTGNALSQESEELQLTKDEIKMVLKDAVEYCFSNGMEISFTSPGWIEENFFEELCISTPSCGACLSNMAVTPGGNVVPCQSWLSDAPLGNMLRDEWDYIWNSEACSTKREYSAMMLGECPLRRKHED